MKRKNLARTLAVIALALAIAGIWLIKNRGDGERDDPAAVGDDAFLLEAAEIDLEALISYGIPIVIDFGSDACIPCVQMAPVLEAVNKEMYGKAFVKFVDVRKYGGIAADFRIQVIPTQVFINADGTPYLPGTDIGVEFTKRRIDKRTLSVHQGGLTEEQLRMILADMGVGR
ncbi:MAG: Thioredoxin-like protein [Firmicutes bacterium ADurb.Bin153]|nr:MAG: Thioredoxin-like protein [Firmicutes bacterium ADurb.Bin153]